ncbi:transporter [Mycolicibacterium aromaticivorans JS19b1 = JCM 16368]|uniref:Transporter n=1 Tax=Mycolicibacterium aromaticivorans JS19b1 = JCM 16368 TaxID=1440774 RepID=A0A064CQ06_9MYCO|nr:RDD family protein [Mycolicibacterium aromaticivorans]KDF01752.1 transporter [Mycolicibacterium aromaticivorans JS19b1 = JCM 16368]
MARELGSWLSGPEPVKPGDDAGWPGKELGLPESGPRSLARMGRRFLALLIDWLIGYGLAALGMSLGLISISVLSTAVLAIWFVLGVLSVRLFGFTPGQYALGLMVIPVDNRQHVGSGRAIARGLLLALVIPGLFTDADGRGLQDRLTMTAVVRR